MKRITAIALALILLAASVFMAGFGKKKPVLTLYTWMGMFPEEILEDYTRETGTEINYVSFDTDEAMLAKLEAAEGGDYDLVIADDYIVETVIQEGLGSIKSTYGSIYVFGNHDKRYFGNGYYTVEQIRESMAANGVTILEDEHVAFNDNKICVIGRQDANVASRKAPIMLEANMNNDGISDDAFIIVADHQPTDCDAESRMHFDLVVSGHTHGGQMFPIGEISKIFGMNDIIYGLEERNGTSFVVTSGIADWEIPFKMGCKSEYVVIDVIGTK